MLVETRELRATMFGDVKYDALSLFVQVAKDDREKSRQVCRDSRVRDKIARHRANNLVWSFVRGRIGELSEFRNFFMQLLLEHLSGFNLLAQAFDDLYDESLTQERVEAFLLNYSCILCYSKVDFCVTSARSRRRRLYASKMWTSNWPVRKRTPGSMRIMALVTPSA